MSKQPAQTGAQVTAADPTQSVWVSANAGTGKTHVLIERILRLLLAGTPPNRILCLTFTKAAAAEVATRLSTRLGHWAAVDDKGLEEELQEFLGKPPGDEETARARSLFARVLETPEGIRVRNLHSFAESLLSRFPIEAELAPHFSVIDERRATELRAEARDRLLTGGGAEGKSVRGALRRLAGLINQEQFAEVMRELDDKRSDFKRLIEAHGGHEGGHEGLMAAVRGTLGLNADESVDTVLKDAAADSDFDGAGLKRAATALDEGSQTDKDRAGVIRAWLAMSPEKRAPALTGDYGGVFLTRKQEARKKVTTKGTDKACPEAEAILRIEQDRLLAVVQRLKACAMADATEALLIVGEALLAAYEDMKRSRALLDYDDLIEKAQALLSRGGGVSWVHYKLDGGIDHVLVDEAQDTSPEQWAIIAGLTGEFFTGLGAGDQDRPLARTVFAVGDEKQSIYSFQGADPARFGIMRDHFRAQASALDLVLPEVEMAVSYRSSAAILEAVDAVFANEAAADGLTWEGRPIHHHSNRQGQGGLVELWPTQTPEDVPDTLPWDAPLDQIGQESPAARLAEKIAETIHVLWRGKEILESAARPIEPGDIMILVRTRGAFADIMVRALERRGVPVAGRDRLKLMDHLAVMDLMAVGHFALLPGDDLTLASVLKGPFIEFDDQALFDLAHKRPGTLWQALGERRNERPEFSQAEQKLSSLLAAADATPPYEFFARLLEAGGGRRDLLAHLGPEAGEPIDVFLGLALDFERDHVGSLEGFLYWLEHGETDVKREMERGRNEVRVLTVHGAKGLESEIVFLPDTCSMQGAGMAPRLHWPESPNANQANHGPGAVIWRMSQDDEEAVTKHLHEQAREEARREYRRLLYVAMTRARDRLYIGGWEGKNGRPEGCWYDLVEPAMQDIGEEVELPTGETVWRLAKPQQSEPDGAQVVAERFLDSEPAPDWALRPPTSEPEPARPLAPSRPSGEEPPVISPLDGDDANRFQRGLLVHRLLQSLPEMPPENREAAGRAFLDRPSLGLTAQGRDEILAETLAVMNHPDHAALFGPGSLAEVPVTGVLGTSADSTVLSGQIDRLLVTDDAVTIIDYKTNRPPPETIEQVSPVYLRQMAAYRELLKSVYPDRPVRALLLWTVGPRIMRLSDENLDAHAP